MTASESPHERFSNLVITKLGLSLSAVKKLIRGERVYFIELNYEGKISSIRELVVEDVEGMYLKFSDSRKVNLHFYYSIFLVARKHVRPF